MTALARGLARGLRAALETSAQVRLWNVAYLQEDGEDDAASRDDAPMEAADSDSDSDDSDRGKGARGSGGKHSSKQLPQGGSASFFSDL